MFTKTHKSIEIGGEWGIICVRKNRRKI
jgi:hypothetical protein